MRCAPGHALGPLFQAEEQAGKGGQEEGRLSQSGLAKAQGTPLGFYSKQRKRLGSHGKAARQAVLDRYCGAQGSGLSMLRNVSHAPFTT